MSRKSSVPSDNGQVFDATASEPADTSFDPADLERGVAPAAEAPDPFDPAALRLSGDFTATIGVRKALLAVPVRKPEKSWWVRVHPEPAYRLQTAVIELKEDRGSETYLVAPALRSQLVTEPTFRLKLLATAVNRQGTLFLWEVNLPRPDGRADEWSRTALDGVNLATQGWVRIAANMQAGFYDVFKASGELAEPEWPDVPFRDMLRVAFRDRLIDTLDHPVLRRLRGEV
jgi:hypothetical protein